MASPKSILITKRLLDATAPRSRRYEIWDSQISGFGVRVGPSGIKTFVVRYRAEGGGRSAPKRFVSIGRFGALTVEQARKRAKEVLAAAALGARCRARVVLLCAV